MTPDTLFTLFTRLDDYPLLTLNQLRLLLVVFQQPGITCVAITEQGWYTDKRSRQTVATVVSRLAEGRKNQPGLHLIQKTPDALDNRINHLTLTPVGQALIESLFPPE